jgi:hypothetical protein
MVCPKDGGVVAVGRAWDQRDDTTSPVLIRFTDQWERISFPDEFADATASALAALSNDEIWLAVSCGGPSDRCRPRFLRWTAGRWDVVEPPTLPGGRSSGYTITDLQLLSRDVGWAIANDYDGPGLVRGLLFHYRDGVWRNRNWNWHFWDQPGFGLFGD